MAARLSECFPVCLRAFPLVQVRARLARRFPVYQSADSFIKVLARLSQCSPVYQSVYSFIKVIARLSRRVPVFPALPQALERIGACWPGQSGGVVRAKPRGREEWCALTRPVAGSGAC